MVTSTLLAQLTTCMHILVSVVVVLKVFIQYLYAQTVVYTLPIFIIAVGSGCASENRPSLFQWFTVKLINQADVHVQSCCTLCGRWCTLGSRQRLL